MNNGNNDNMMGSTSGTPTSDSSNSNIFPSSTATSTSSDDSSDSSNTNVYYLVFLGVLVVLMSIALILAVRAMRMRRRYRAAARLALERGEAVPDTIREEFWGLGGLSGWNTDGWDRFGTPHGRGRDHGKNDRKWEKIPILIEAEEEKEKGDDGELWDHIRPLTVQSLRPPSENEANADRYAELHNRHAPRVSSNWYRAPRLILRRSDNDVVPEASQRTPISSQPKINDERPLETSDPLRLAVVIQMPIPGGGKQRYVQGEDDEGVAWENGMELGVWEGFVEGRPPVVGPSTTPARESVISQEDGRGLVRSRSEESYGNANFAQYR